eukprot:jgi/Botrbrau1/21587/Bobra.0424s0001.1
MQDSLTLARKFLAAAQERQAAQANRHRRAVIYKKGDLVLLRTKFPAALTSQKYIKLARRRIGPFRVTAVHPNSVELDVPAALKFHPRINVEYVDLYKGPRNPDRLNIYKYQPGPRMVKGDDGTENAEYVVDGILGHRPWMKGNRALHFPDGTPSLPILGTVVRLRRRRRLGALGHVRPRKGHHQRLPPSPGVGPAQVGRDGRLRPFPCCPLLRSVTLSLLSLGGNPCRVRKDLHRQAGGRIANVCTPSGWDWEWVAHSGVGGQMSHTMACCSPESARFG